MITFQEALNAAILLAIVVIPLAIYARGKPYALSAEGLFWLVMLAIAGCAVLAVFVTYIIVLLIAGGIHG